MNSIHVRNDSFRIFVQGRSYLGDMGREVVFHSTLKQLMEKRRMSAKELSRATSIPASTLSTYLSGKKAAYAPEHLSGLSEFFNISVDALLFGVPNQKDGNLDEFIEDIKLGKFDVILRRSK